MRLHRKDNNTDMRDNNLQKQKYHSQSKTTDNSTRLHAHAHAGK